MAVQVTSDVTETRECLCNYKYRFYIPKPVSRNLHNNPEVSVGPQGFHSCVVATKYMCRDNIDEKDWGMGWLKGKSQHIRVP